MLVDDLFPFLRSLPPDVHDTVVRILLAALALLATFLLRGMLTRLIIRPLRRRAEGTASRLDDQVLNIIQQPVQVLIVAIGFSLAAQTLVVDEATTFFVSRTIRSLIIIAIAVAIFRVAEVMAFNSAQLRLLTGLSVEERLVPFVRVSLRLVIIALTISIILQEWGYDVTGLIAGLGLSGLAISLAAKDTIENLFGFSAIVTDRPFVVGDYIVVGDTEGTVEHVGLRSTRLRRRDQARITVPNSRLVSAVVTNLSRMNKRWIDLTLGVGPETKSAQLQTLLARLRALLKAHPKIDPDSVVVLFTGISGVRLEIMIRAYMTLPSWVDFMRERETLNFQIMDVIQEMELIIR